MILGVVSLTPDDLLLNEESAKYSIQNIYSPNILANVMFSCSVFDLPFNIHVMC